MVRKYTAQRPMEVIPSGAKAYPEAMSQEAGAMAGFGGTVMSVTQRWQAERDTFEISKIQSAYNDYHYKQMRKLETDWMSGIFKDASQFKQADEDFEKDREKFISDSLKGKRGRIADNVRRYTDATHDQQAVEYFSSLYSKEKEFRSVEGLKLVEGAIQRGDKNEALKIISQFEHWFGLGKAQIMRDNLDAQFAEVQHQAFLEQVAVDTRGMPIKEALSYINEIPRTAITETERNGLIRQRERQEEIATATTDPMVRWKILREITDNPKLVTDDYLESNIKPDGLSVNDAEALRKIRDDKDSPLKTPRAQLYFNSLDALYDERETDAEQRIKYDIANEKLMQFFTDNPKATVKQAAEFYDELIHPVILNWFEKLMWTERPQLFGLVGTEKERLAKKKMQSEPRSITEFQETVGSIEDEEEAKAYYEKWKNKW